ncbi:MULTISPECIES: hypothetical protein [unclassified Dyella]|uniref:hypothetical protein n=1 Tax=unclassified Dyella TaxID=2634549 RepID=UPI000C864B85|nr:MULTISPECIES: hypothetical protein [unclassified Dyella]MDR3444990.1 hypothetical protein [Dyella sp.]PMQ05052.1 hypothetical protein DyAD56_11890 [Dyella sp. AD56]
MIRPLTHRIQIKIVALLACLSVGGFTVMPANAQWIVNDPTMQGLVTANQATQITSLADQLSQLEQTYSTIKNTISSMGLNLLPISNSLPIISDSDAQTTATNQCPGADPVSMVANVFGVDMSSDIKGQQTQICYQIVMRQIHKYNIVAGMLNRMNDYSNNLSSLVSGLNSLDAFASGSRQVSQAQTSQSQNALSVEMANVDQQIKADDAIIATLKERQSMLAQTAMKGTMLGNAMQVVTFGAALSVGN